MMAMRRPQMGQRAPMGPMVGGAGGAVPTFGGAPNFGGPSYSTPMAPSFGGFQGYNPGGGFQGYAPQAFTPQVTQAGGNMDAMLHPFAPRNRFGPMSGMAAALQQGMFGGPFQGARVY